MKLTKQEEKFKPRILHFGSDFVLNKQEIKLIKWWRECKAFKDKNKITKIRLVLLNSIYETKSNLKQMIIREVREELEKLKEIL